MIPYRQRIVVICHATDYFWVDMGQAIQGRGPMAESQRVAEQSVCTIWRRYNGKFRNQPRSHVGLRVRA